jgi:hypothetical protein
VTFGGAPGAAADQHGTANGDRHSGAMRRWMQIPIGWNHLIG